MRYYRINNTNMKRDERVKIVKMIKQNKEISALDKIIYLLETKAEELAFRDFDPKDFGCNYKKDEDETKFSYK